MRTYLFAGTVIVLVAAAAIYNLAVKAKMPITRHADVLTIENPAIHLLGATESGSSNTWRKLTKLGSCPT
jgi:hypothetical protein